MARVYHSVDSLDGLGLRGRDDASLVQYSGSIFNRWTANAIAEIHKNKARHSLFHAGLRVTTLSSYVGSYDLRLCIKFEIDVLSRSLPKQIRL